VTLGQDGNLRVRVAAPATEGKANRELLRYLAQVLGVPRTAVVLQRGEGSRYKVVTVAGLDTEAALARLGAQAEG
jgi:uncharacterized protein (TIGR00251 family)